MRVRELMATQISTCTADQSTSEAAHLMWKHDIGFLPVVDAAQQPIGVITDRDICLTACDRELSLKEIPVAAAMTSQVVTCREDDTLDDVERAMREHLVTRLPVVDVLGRLIGIISLSDVAAVCAALPRGAEAVKGAVLQTFVSIVRHRQETFAAEPTS